MPHNTGGVHPHLSAGHLPAELNESKLMDLAGLIMVVGASDAGKTTLVRSLVSRLLALQGRVACIDADPGQSRLGPPTTFSLELLKQSNGHAIKKSWQRFIGSVSPAGHMLQVLAGCGRLVQKARETMDGAIVMDTSGLVDPQKGGVRLKLAKIDLLEPSVLIVLQKAGELEFWVRPLRSARITRVVDIRCAAAVRQRDFSQRQAHREAALRRYFTHAGIRTFYWPDYGVFPDPSFFRHRLLAFEDRQGFVLKLGIVTGCDIAAKEVSVWTPLTEAQSRRVAVISLGDVVVDPSSFTHSITGPNA